MIGQPAVQIDGQGAVTADNLNTMVQTATLANNLRSVTGLTGMLAMLAGITAPNDGGQGTFYWNSASTAPDDNFTIIRPSGVSAGAWVRLVTVFSLSVLAFDPSGGFPGQIYLNSTINNPRMFGTDGQWHTIAFV